MALRFLFSEEGEVFRDFIMNEIIKSADALSREQLVRMVGLFIIMLILVILQMHNHIHYYIYFLYLYYRSVQYLAIISSRYKMNH